ncbi:MAG: pilus assembly protein HicB [Bacteroidales bacterium]|nr:pilus assembly protein HicB [Bacteroidales bacterium]MCQ2280391.1 pilus assembly protein HicB [Bacteroidales bacterium]
MKKRTALIEMGADGTFGIHTPDIESTIIGEGSTVAEAKADFENSLREVIDAFAETGTQDPDDLQNTTFIYKYDLPSFLSYYDYFNMSRLAKQAGINPSLMRQYKNGQYVSEKQVAKIQMAINRIGKELATIQLI